MKNVLVLSATASAINYINSYQGRPDICLHLTDSNRYSPGLYAPNVTAHVLPRARDTAAYRSALQSIIERERIDVLIPTSDYDIEAIVHFLHEGWSPDVALFRPELKAFQTLSHKAELMDCIGRIMPEVVPKTASNPDDIGRFSFPVVIKPASESGGKGVTIVEEAGNFAPALARIRALYNDRFLIQEFVPGRTYVCTLVYDQNGNLSVAAAMRSTLTFFTWGGGGCAGEMVDDDALIALTDRVVKAAGGWRGPINFEWRKHSETQAYFLMEANCRLNGYSYLTTMNGVCFPDVVLALLTGAKLPSIAPPAQRTRNFVLGFRESLVEEWVQATG